MLPLEFLVQPLELVVLAGASSMEFGVHTASGAAIRCKIKHGDFPSIFVCLPEGITPWNHRPIFWQIQNWNISGTWMGIAFSEWLNYYLVSSPLANLDDTPINDQVYDKLSKEVGKQSFELRTNRIVRLDIDEGW